MFVSRLARYAQRHVVRRTKRDADRPHWFFKLKRLFCPSVLADIPKSTERVFREVLIVGVTGLSQLHGLCCVRGRHSDPLSYRSFSRQIEREFQPDTWQAFWQTAVEGRSCEDVAAQLNKGVGAVYAARSRVMKRLQEKVKEYESLES